MKTIIRILITFIAFAASFFFIYWVPFAFIPAARETEIIPALVGIAAGIFVSIYTWKRTGSISNSLAGSILTGGIIVGSICFIGGFIGPIIFYSESNLGPLLGIFITGPIGFVAGLIGGGLFWIIKEKKAKRLS